MIGAFRIENWGWANKAEFPRSHGSSAPKLAQQALMPLGAVCLVASISLEPRSTGRDSTRYITRDDCSLADKIPIP